MSLQMTLPRFSTTKPRSSCCDARAEGVGEGPQEGWVTGPVVAYADLWDSINGRDAWLLNPWVWVIEFKRIAP
jgi:hypothetical protein